MKGRQGLEQQMLDAIKLAMDPKNILPPGTKPRPAPP
jgi:hypothetical protein